MGGSLMAASPWVAAADPDRGARLRSAVRGTLLHGGLLALATVAIGAPPGPATTLEAVKLPTYLGQQDVITQELEELEGLLRLSEERIALLERLQQAAVGEAAELMLPEEQARMLRVPLPRLADSPLDGAAPPSSAPEDYLTTKAVIRLQEPASLLKFLPVRASSSYSLQELPIAPPPSILVAAQANGRVRLFAPSGEPLLEFGSGHDREVTTLAVSPSWAQGDTLIATGDAGGVIRVHKVQVRQRRSVRAEDTVSLENDTQFFGLTVGSAVNVTAQFQRQLEVLVGRDGEPSRMTAVAMASQKGSKYFVVGDAEGKISVFTLGGAFLARMDATVIPGAGIEGFYVHLSQLLFRAGAEWGYLDLERLEVKHVVCPDYEASRITAAIIDSQHAWRVVAADEEGALSVLAIRNARNCRVEHRFSKRLTRAPVELASVRGFALVLERAGRSPGAPAALVAINMSHVGKSELDLRGAPSSVVWRRPLPPVRAWAVYRHRQDAPAGDLLAFLSQDGLEIEIWELLMQITLPPVGDPYILSPWVWASIAIGLTLTVVGWHYLVYGRHAGKKEKKAEEGAPAEEGM